MPTQQLNREQLEEQARMNVCSCWAYTLAGAMDDTPDEELRAVIDHPMALHYESQKHDPVSVDEFIEELRKCPEYAETGSQGKYYVSEELGCVYRLHPQVGALEVAYMFSDGTFDPEDFGEVDPGVCGEERVTFQGTDTDLDSVFATVTKLLEGKA